MAWFRQLEVANHDVFFRICYLSAVSINHIAYANKDGNRAREKYVLLVYACNNYAR